jgi:sarcosine oxidase subunit gamma
MGEVKGWSLVQVACFPQTRSELRQILASQLDTQPPEEVGYATHARGDRLLKTGSDRYWIISPSADNGARALHTAIGPGIGVVTTLSHSRSCIFIEGSAARDVLASGIAVDLHPDVFGIDRFALTALHHTPVMLYRVDTQRYELFPLRTYASWLWGWLADAVLPFTRN